MKKVLAIAMLVLGAVFVVGRPVPAAAQREQQQSRSLAGTVSTDSGPAADAIVYLKNTRTLAVKTYIAGPDGTYQFHALAPNVDYEVYADLKGRKSDVKTVSSFDRRSQVTINLKIK